MQMTPSTHTVNATMEIQSTNTNTLMHLVGHTTNPIPVLPQWYRLKGIIDLSVEIMVWRAGRRHVRQRRPEGGHPPSSSTNAYKAGTKVSDRDIGSCPNDLGITFTELGTYDYRNAIIPVFT
jgi:hypothetical protein